MKNSFPLFTHYYGKRAHLGICGSIAAYKILDLLRLLLKSNLDVGVTLTKSGSEFIPALNFQALGADPVFTQDDLLQSTFAHLAPGQTAHTLLIAPATANILAKAAHGIADDLLSTQIVSFPGPIIFAPAMNPKMWHSPATKENWQKLKSRGYICIEPGEGHVACGDTGQGRLPSIENIYFPALKAITPQDLINKKILITCGPTREYFDQVRFWSNPSTGKMGLALSLAAWLRGAEVHLVHGPINVLPLPGLNLYPAHSAKEMYAVCMDLWPNMDMGCFTAAVADFSPESCPVPKFKKSDTRQLKITFTKTKDILATIGNLKTKAQKLIGFAAEAESLHHNCLQKLKKKNLDLIIGNLITDEDSAFASDQNRVYVLDRTNRQESWPLLPKTEVAWRIWDWILTL
jgi:phosphopantothenoylcysteine decarboxylase/phosphopantothenate--cysteine ligase